MVMLADKVNGSLVHVRRFQKGWACRQGSKSGYEPLELFIASWRKIHGNSYLVFDDEGAIEEFQDDEHAGEYSKRVARAIPMLRSFGSTSLLMTVDELALRADRQGYLLESAEGESRFDRIASAEIIDVLEDGIDQMMFAVFSTGCWWSPFSSDNGLYQYCQQMRLDEAMLLAHRGVHSDLLVQLSGREMLDDDGNLILLESAARATLPALDLTRRAVVTRHDRPGMHEPRWVFLSGGHEVQDKHLVGVGVQFAPAAAIPHCLCGKSRSQRDADQRVMPLDVLAAVS